MVYCSFLCSSFIFSFLYYSLLFILLLAGLEKMILTLPPARLFIFYPRSSTPPPILLTCPQGFSLLPKIWIMAERSLEYAHHVAVTWLQGWCRNGMDRWTGDSTGGIEYSQVFSVALLLTVFNLQLFHMSPALSLRGLFFFPLGFHWVLFVSGMIRCFLSSHCPQSHIFAYTFKFCRSFLWNGLFNCHQLVSLSNRRQILPPTALEQL